MVAEARKKLRKLVRETGSQKAAARRLGVSGPYVSMILNGHAAPSVAVCRSLGLEVPPEETGHGRRRARTRERVYDALVRLHAKHPEGVNIWRLETRGAMHYDTAARCLLELEQLGRARREGSKWFPVTGGQSE